MNHWGIVPHFTPWLRGWSALGDPNYTIFDYEETLYLKVQLDMGFL